MISAHDAMGQAVAAAQEYFNRAQELVESAYPKASTDAKLAAAVELCKVAAQDFHSWQIGNVAETTIAKLDGRLHSIEQSIDNITWSDRNPV